MSQINPYILDYETKDYGEVDASGCELDCSLGVNPEPVPAEVMEALKNIPAGEVKSYPNNPGVLSELSALILKRYKKIAPELGAENLYFGCGSYDLLAGVTLLYSNVNKTVLGHAPQFGAYVDFVNCFGTRFVPYYMEASKNYELDAKAFARLIEKEKPALTVCENPNNPTGQVIGPDKIGVLLNAAKHSGSALLVDEAYGDYLREEDSAIALIGRAEKEGVDLLVTRSFSKGFGLAGMRLGYVMGPARAIKQLGKFGNLFNGNGLAKILAAAALKAENGETGRLGDTTAEKNRYLYNEIRKMNKFRMAETSLRTPIFTLYVEDADIDLSEKLAEAGICSVSCAAYEGLGKNAARMMLCSDTKRLVELLKEVSLKI